jgi:hypothetical protein
MNKNPLQDPVLLTAALEGLELQKARIEEQILAVRSLLGKPRRGRPRKEQGVAASAPAPSARVTAPRASRRANALSDEAKQRISLAQKKRWAKFRKEQRKAAKTPASKAPAED